MRHEAGGGYLKPLPIPGDNGRTEGGAAPKKSSYGYMMLEGNTTPSERTMTIGRRFAI